MSARGILDIDMATLGRLVSEGWRWWCAEMLGLIPARFRRRREILPRLVFQGDELVPEAKAGSRWELRPKPGLRVAIVVPRHLCLARTIDRPALGDRDLQRMVAIEGEALLPFPPGTALFAGRRIGPAAEPGRMSIEVAGLPIDAVRDIILAVEADGVTPARIWMQEDREDGWPIDFAPAAREAGLLISPRSATPFLWVVVGFLIALNLAVMIWHDVATTNRVAQLVQQQQPSVSVAQIITRRTDQDRALVARSLALRGTHDALGGLMSVGRVLPEGAWLQRYVWDGATVRLTGYRPTKTDVATALRRSGRFAEVRSMNDETQATVPAGDPFDLTARMAGR